MGGYLIPANSKKSMLIFGVFNHMDLYLIGGSLIVSFLLLMILPIDELGWGLLAITPGIIGAFLVFPVPNYHNIITVIMEGYRFYTSRQKYIWKGWCFNHGEDKK